MALNYCSSTVSANNTKNCVDPVIGGIKKTAYLFNKSDIDLVTTNESQEFVDSIPTFKIKAGKKGFQIDNAINSVVEKVDGTYTNTWKKTITGVLLDDGVFANYIISALGKKEAEFIVIIQNEYINYSYGIGICTAFEIIGLNVPLRSAGQAIINDKNSKDSMGGWLFGLSTEENYPKTFFDAGGYTATKALFDAFGTVAV